MEKFSNPRNKNWILGLLINLNLHETRRRRLNLFPKSKFIGSSTQTWITKLGHHFIFVYTINFSRHKLSTTVIRQRNCYLRRLKFLHKLVSRTWRLVYSGLLVSPTNFSLPPAFSFWNAEVKTNLLFQYNKYAGQRWILEIRLDVPNFTFDGHTLGRHRAVPIPISLRWHSSNHGPCSGWFEWPTWWYALQGAHEQKVRTFKSSLVVIFSIESLFFAPFIMPMLIIATYSQLSFTGFTPARKDHYEFIYALGIRHHCDYPQHCYRDNASQLRAILSGKVLWSEHSVLEDRWILRILAHRYVDHPGPIDHCERDL